MKRLLLLVFILLTSYTVRAQTINMGHSVVLWGQTPQTVQVDIEYKDVVFTGIQVYGGPFADQHGMLANHSFIGLFYTPDINIYNKIVISPMAGILDKPFPNINGERVMLGVEIKKEIYDNLSFYYKHISNGYRGVTNVGLDSIGLKLEI